MTASVSAFKDLYDSPNGDRWSLSTDSTGKLVVVHHPNKSSGGRPSEFSVEVFLSQGGQGPEHHALMEALASLGNGDDARQELSLKATEKLSRALGESAARLWSSLPQDIQHSLFEGAVMAEGEIIRQQLALYLHGRHERTVEAAQARAMPEPGSLGG